MANPMTGWQPIETYRGEPDEWVFAINGKIPFVAAMDDEGGWYTFNLCYEVIGGRGKPLRKFEPTHWAPFFDPPSDTSASLLSPRDGYINPNQTDVGDET